MAVYLFHEYLWSSIERLERNRGGVPFTYSEVQDHIYEAFNSDEKGLLVSLRKRAEEIITEQQVAIIKKARREFASAVLRSPEIPERTFWKIPVPVWHGVFGNWLFAFTLGLAIAGTTLVQLGVSVSLLGWLPPLLNRLFHS